MERRRRLVHARLERAAPGGRLPLNPLERVAGAVVADADQAAGVFEDRRAAAHVTKGAARGQAEGGEIVEAGEDGDVLLGADVAPRLEEAERVAGAERGG